MPLASTNPSFGSIRLQPFHRDAGERRAVELSDALRPQLAEALVAGGRLVDHPRAIDAQAGGAGGGAGGGAAAALTEAPRSWWACRTMSGRRWRAWQQRLYAGSVDRLEPVGLGGCQVEPPSLGVPRNPRRSSGRQRDPSRTSGRTRRCLRGATADVRISRRYSRPGSMLAERRYLGRDRRCGWLHGWNMRSRRRI